MQINVKKLHENAVIPSYAKHGDTGMDLTAVSYGYDEYGNVFYGTGLAFEIPAGFVGYVFPRSSNSKKDLILSNSVGVIDSGYRGEVVLKFKPSVQYSEEQFSVVTPEKYNLDHYSIGDRIGQIIIMPIPHIEFNEVSDLSDTERGTGGFGSTGN